MSISKEINTVLTAIYSALLENQPTLKLKLHLELVWELKVWTRRVNSNLGSLVYLCLLIAICELDIVVSVLFLNIATRHALPARLLNFWRRLILVQTKGWKRAQTWLNLDMLP